MDIGGVHVSRGERPFVIAEMSGNHSGTLDTALRIVDAVARTGAQAIKMQTYTAETMTLDVDRPEFRINEDTSLWSGRTLYELYEEAHTPWEWHEPIIQRARERGLICFSSPFDTTAVDFLDGLGVPCFKIASFECVDLPLIRYAASTGKPLIISTGLATMEEISEAVETARVAGCRDLVLLKCTSSYPASPDDANLAAMATLRSEFGCEVGLSDHTLGTAVSVAAVALGATVIEKHVTLDRAGGGVDAAFSLEPAELSDLVEATDQARRAIGSSKFGPGEAERGARSRRRSLYVAQDLRDGDALTRTSLRSIRPGLGLAPKYLDELLGRRVVRDVPRGTPMAWDLLGMDETNEQ